MSGAPSVEWLGCATFRVRIKGRTLFFDTFVDRIASAAPVGVSSDTIDDADFLFISHSHLDHILGADTIAKNTGAPVIGSHETIRVMAENDVPAEQRWAVSGGETVDCGEGVTVRVFPSLHSCIWAGQNHDSGACCCGDEGVHYQARRARSEEAFEALHTLTPEVEEYIAAEMAHISLSDGGQLNYLLQSSEGSILIASSAGYWTGIMRDLRPDVAILALAGRPNIDGEPFQGSVAQFIAGEVELLRPRTVAFCHHDAWMPPVPPIDVEPVAHELARRTPAAKIADLPLAEPMALLAG